jgi:hypothetical protein
VRDADHVKAFRLFELSRAENAGKDFQLEAWEKQHLQQCAECRGVIGVFARQFKGRSISLPDRNSPPTATQRFNAGDQIEIVGPGEHHGKKGTVTKVLEPRTGDFVYRYEVRLEDGTSGLFFGFEIENV